MPQIKVNASATRKGGRIEPLWKGPTVDGITQSLIQKYLCCPERFRIKVIEGWEARDTFRHQLEYGNMWHLCEEEFARCGHTRSSIAFNKLIDSLMVRYPFQRKEIEKWGNVCLTQFPLYTEFWAKHPDVTKRIPVLQENEFKVPITLPSGRVVILRGKLDSTDIINQAYWIQENKAKGEVDEEKLKKMLTYDLQTMMYIVALSEAIKQKHIFTGKKEPLKPLPIMGVRYNVIRRPLSGGKGTIKQSEGTKGSKCPKCKGINPMNYHSASSRSAIPGMMVGGPCSKCGGVGRIGAKPAESDTDFYGRLAQYIKDEPKEYFFRWNVSITHKDIETFKQQTLIPVLENICDDYEWWQQVLCPKPIVHPRVLASAGREKPRLWDTYQRQHLFPDHCHRHYRLPFGVYNPIMEGYETEFDEYLRTGNTAGLHQCKNLFPELSS